MAYIDNIALRGGVYGGWNYQITADWVVGIEADFGWANETAISHGSAYPSNLLFGSPSLPFGATPKTTSGSPRLGRQHSAARRKAPYPLDFAICERRFGLGPHSSYIDLFHYSDCKCIKLCPWQLLFRDTWTRHHRAVGHRAWLDRRRSALRYYSGHPIGSLVDSIACPGSTISGSLLLFRPRELHWLPFRREQPAECLFSGADDAAFFEFGIAYKFGS